MITEFVEIDIKPGMEQKFVEGVEASKEVFARAPGCHGIQLHHSIENPQHFVLLIKWDNVAAHTEKFQKSPDYLVWRGNVGEYFADKPKVWHAETAIG